MPSHVNTLVLGQGLAGTLLSYELIRRGEAVLVVDDGDPGAASRIAAGLVSPVTGQRTALIWRAAELLELARKSYAALESLLGRRLYFPLPLRRLYVDDESRRRFRARKLEPAHEPWLGEEFENGMEIMGAAWLDAGALCQAWRAHLKSKNCLLESGLDFNEVEFNQDGLRWRGIHAQRMVACMGAKEPGQGLFNFLKFQPTKGELLTVKADSNEEAIHYASHFAIPLGQGRFRVGATYDRQDLNPDPTPAGLAALKSSALELLGEKIGIEAHEAGIRPNLLGHFPALGAHPAIKNLMVMNGMGSKGALWAPTCAKMLADWMRGEGEIAKELNVKRFWPPISV